MPGGAVLAAVANDGSSGTPENETVSLLDLTPGPSFDVVGATNASPIRITTSLPHGFTSGQQVSVAGVQGNTAANGLFFIKIQSDDTDATFTLNGTTGNGNYTSGGIVVLVPERTDVVVGQRARAVAFTSVRAPHATLVAEPRTTKVGNEVQYDGSGSVDVDGTIEKYTFDFDDGTVITKVCATDPDPANCAKASHVYTRAGTFRAGLIVTDNDGATSRKDLAPSVAVRANRAPIAKFTMAPMSGRVPLVTTATDLSKDLDGTVVQRCWTLVAGNPVCDSTDANPTFTFTESGKHKVTLVVTDDSGTASKPYSKTVNVIPNKLPKATFTISPTSVKAGVARHVQTQGQRRRRPGRGVLLDVRRGLDRVRQHGAEPHSHVQHPRPRQSDTRGHRRLRGPVGSVHAEHHRARPVNTSKREAGRAPLPRNRAPSPLPPPLPYALPFPYRLLFPLRPILPRATDAPCPDVHGDGARFAALGQRRLRRLGPGTCNPLRDARQLPGQGDTCAGVVGAGQPLLVGGEAAHVVHLEEELPGSEGIAGVFPGQLEEAKALRRPLVAGHEIAVEMRADIGMV